MVRLHISEFQSTFQGNTISFEVCFPKVKAVSSATNFLENFKSSHQEDQLLQMAAVDKMEN